MSSRSRALSDGEWPPQYHRSTFLVLWSTKYVEFVIAVGLTLTNIENSNMHYRWDDVCKSSAQSLAPSMQTKGPVVITEFIGEINNK